MSPLIYYRKDTTATADQHRDSFSQLYVNLLGVSFTWSKSESAHLTGSKCDLRDMIVLK